MPAKIFISHRHSGGRPAAAALWDFLRQVYGRSVLFFDYQNVAPDGGLPQQIRAAIEKSEVVLLVVDEQLELHPDQTQDWVTAELSLAASHGRDIYPVFPVAEDDSRWPEFVERWQRIRATVGPPPATPDSPPPRIPDVTPFAFPLRGERAVADPMARIREIRAGLTMVSRLVEKLLPFRTDEQGQPVHPHEFEVAIGGHAGPRDDFAWTSLQSLGQALYELKAHFPKVTLTIRLCTAEWEPRKTRGSAPGLLDVAEQVERARTNQDSWAVRDGEVNWWRQLAEWRLPGLGAVDFDGKVELGDLWASGQLRPRPRLLVTLGIPPSDQRRLPSWAGGAWRSRPYTTSGSRKWDLQWVGIPLSHDDLRSGDGADPETISGRRLQRLGKGALDATGIALSSWIIARIHFYAVYLPSRDDLGTRNDYAHDLFRLLRASLLASRAQPSATPQILAVVTGLLGAALVATLVLAFRGVLPVPHRPATLTVCTEAVPLDPIRREVEGLAEELNYVVEPPEAPGHLASLSSGGVRQLDIVVRQRDADPSSCDLVLTSAPPQAGEPLGLLVERHRLVPVVSANAPRRSFDALREELCPSRGEPSEVTVLVQPESTAVADLVAADLCDEGASFDDIQSFPDDEAVLKAVAEDVHAVAFVLEDVFEDTEDWLLQKVQRLPSPKNAFVRDLRYTLDPARTTSTWAYAFTESIRKRQPNPRVRLCGSSSIGDELAPELLRRFVSQVENEAVGRNPRERLAPHPLGASIPNRTLSLLAAANDEVLYDVEIATPGSGRMVELVQATPCDIGMTDLAAVDVPPTWETLHYADQSVVTIASGPEVDAQAIQTALCRPNRDVGPTPIRFVLRTSSSGTRRAVLDALCGTHELANRVDVVERVSNHEVYTEVAASGGATEAVVGFVPEHIWRDGASNKAVRLVPWIVGATSIDEQRVLVRPLYLFFDPEADHGNGAHPFWRFLFEERRNYIARFHLSSPSACEPEPAVGPPCEGCTSPYPAQEPGPLRRTDHTLLFAQSSAEFPVERQREIEAIASRLRNADCGEQDLHVFGIESPPTVGGLDQARADAIARALVAEGFDPAKVHAHGVGADVDGEPRVEIWVAREP